MLDRLEFELQERTRLSQEEAVLKKRKLVLQGSVRGKADFLARLPNQVKAIRKASTPLQQFFKVNTITKLRQHSSAKSLPGPLFVLFAQMEAYRDRVRTEATVSILGQLADAEAWYSIRDELKDRAAVELDDDNPDAAGGLDEEESGRRSKRAKLEASPSQTETPPGATAGFAAPHVFPLSLSMEIPVANTTGHAVLCFSYDAGRQSVDVHCAFRADGHDQAMPSAAILANIDQGDSGLVQSEHAAELDDAHRALPRPYRWAQTLCGLGAETDADAVVSDVNQQAAWSVAADRSHMFGIVMSRILERIAAQLSLKGQLQNLEKLTIEPSAIELLPQVASLLSWDRLASASETDGETYTATIECDSGSKVRRGILVATIEIPVDYPVRAPVFSLNFEKHPGKKSAEEHKGHRPNANTNVLKEIETIVNSQYETPDALDSRKLLTWQAQTLLRCAAVHASTLSHAAQGTATLFCERGSRGRDRRCAMRFDSAAQQYTQVGSI